MAECGTVNEFLEENMEKLGNHISHDQNTVPGPRHEAAMQHHVCFHGGTPKSSPELYLHEFSEVI